MKNFLEYIKESSEVKEVIDYNDILDKFNDDRNKVVEYLRNLLLGKIITVWYKRGDEQTMKSVDGLERSEVHSVKCTDFITINNHFIVKGDQINILNDKRKLNLEDDPFGEENYGYIQESNHYEPGTLMNVWKEFSGNKFKIESLLNKKLVGKKIQFRCHGTVYYEKIDRVKLDDFFTFYSENGAYEGVDLNYPIEELFIGKRIINLEDDPFGEENYGSVQESNDWVENTLMELWDDLNGDTDKINQQLNKSISGKEITFMWKKIVLTDTIGKAEYDGDVFVFHSENGYIYSGVSLMYPIDALNDKRNKRIINLEDDPFGEENYGSIQESVMDYEFLKNYIIGFSNTEQMIDIAKKIKDIGFKVYNYDEVIDGVNYGFSAYVWSKIHEVFNRCGYNMTGDWIRIRYDDFIDLISKNNHISKIYSDDDPFGEEI